MSFEYFNVMFLFISDTYFNKSDVFNFTFDSRVPRAFQKMNFWLYVAPISSEPCLNPMWFI